MTLLFIILVGGLVGGLMSPAIRGTADDGSFADVALGVVGALLGGFALTPLLGSAPIAGDRVSAEAFLVALIGAAVVVSIAAVRGRNSLG